MMKRGRYKKNSYYIGILKIIKLNTENQTLTQSRSNKVAFFILQKLQLYCKNYYFCCKM